MSETKEYIVTLKNKEDLDQFYHDMECDHGDDCIPNREVECSLRRPISRNTHYMLTDEEVENLKNDPRVLSIENASMLLEIVKPLYTQTGNFDKSGTNNSAFVNWALLRCTEGEQRANWGSNGTASQSDGINFNSSGKNVDVIVIDGHINPDHPEYAVNPDGTGGSRVVQLNWNSLTAQADSLDNDNAAILGSTYVYTPYDNGNTDLTADNNHGAHCAGTACGSTQGWARKANIYNINPYGSNVNPLSSLIMWDYIRAFHRNKQVNPETGVRNPTICNGSYGSALKFPFTYSSFTTGPIVYINYRGQDFGPTNGSGPALSDAVIEQCGIRVSNGVAEVPFYSVSVAADIQDAISDGVIVVAAAGNEYSKVDIPGGTDYGNFFYARQNLALFLWYSHRGTAPSAVPGVICVGSVGPTVDETKSNFSNCGPRIDIFAPGHNVMSSFNSTTSFGGTNDPRNSDYKVGKISGTSMASPQVCGVLACLLETYPNLTPSQALDWLIKYAKTGQMNDGGGGQSDLTSLQGAANRYLFAFKERPDVGVSWPRNKYFLRPSSGLTYPRTKIRR
jgi:subtilisin family serine protease